MLFNKKILRYFSKIMVEDRTGEHIFHIITNAYMDDFSTYDNGFFHSYRISYYKSNIDLDYFEYGSPGRRSDYDCGKGYLFET